MWFLLHLTNHRCGYDIAIPDSCHICIITEVVRCYSRFLLHLTNHRCDADNVIRGFCYIWLIIDVFLTLLYDFFCYIWLIIDVAVTLLYAVFVTSDWSSMWFWHCYTRFLLQLTNHRCGSDITIRDFCYIWLIIDVVLTLLYAVFVTSD